MQHYRTVLLLLLNIRRQIVLSILSYPALLQQGQVSKIMQTQFLNQPLAKRDLNILFFKGFTSSVHEIEFTGHKEHYSSLENILICSVVLKQLFLFKGQRHGDITLTWSGLSQLQS